MALERLSGARLRTKSLAFLLLAIGLASSIALCVTFTAQDLRIYRQAGISLWEGSNPYGLPQFLAYAQKFDIGRVDGGTLQIWTPPPSLFVPLLLGLLSPATAVAVWLCALVLCLALGFHCYRQQRKGAGNAVAALAAIGLLSPLIVHGIAWGSITPFEALAFFGLVSVLSRDGSGPGGSGILLFLASFKPQLIAAPLLRYAIGAFQRRDLLLSLPVAGSLSALVVTGAVLLRPTVLEDYLTMDRTVFFSHAASTVSLPLVLHAQPWVDLWRYSLVVVLFLFAAAAFLTATAHLPLGRQLIEFSPLTFLVIPYSWAHDYIVLIPWLMLLLHDSFLDRHALRRCLFLLGLGLWLVGDVILARDIVLGHHLARYPLVGALCVWIAVRLLQLRAEPARGNRYGR